MNKKRFVYILIAAMVIICMLFCSCRGKQKPEEQPSTSEFEEITSEDVVDFPDMPFEY